MTQRKITALTLGILSLTGLLASCGTPATPDTAPVAAKGTPDTAPVVSDLTAKFTPAGSLQEQIVYGTISARGARPYQVYLSIRTSGGSFMCGGSVIAPQWILTAAHCLDGASASGVSVRAGVNKLSSTQGVTNSAAALYMHPSYNTSTNANDIALIKLSSALTYDTYIQAVKLPNSTVESVLDVAGKRAIVSGWGKTETGSTSDDLREVSIPITPNPTSCGGSSVPANTICGEADGGKDSCGGDSGGPLAQAYNGNNYVLGIVSYGPSACRGYGVYTRVNGFLSWIAQVSGVTADGGSTPTPTPTPTPGTTTYSGSLSSGQSAYAPSSTGFAYAGGTIKGVLSGPTGTDFDLYLQKMSSTGTWSNVASSLGSTSSETINYAATSGTYRWRVYAYSGSGSLTLTETK